MYVCMYVNIIISNMTIRSIVFPLSFIKYPYNAPSLALDILSTVSSCVAFMIQLLQLESEQFPPAY